MFVYLFVFPGHELIFGKKIGKVFERNVSIFGALWEYTNVNNFLQLGGNKVVKYGP